MLAYISMRHYKPAARFTHVFFGAVALASAALGSGPSGCRASLDSGTASASSAEASSPLERAVFIDVPVHWATYSGVVAIAPNVVLAPIATLYGDGVAVPADWHVIVSQRGTSGDVVRQRRVVATDAIDGSPFRLLYLECPFETESAVISTAIDDSAPLSVVSFFRSDSEHCAAFNSTIPHAWTTSVDDLLEKSGRQRCPDDRGLSPLFVPGSAQLASVYLGTATRNQPLFARPSDFREEFTRRVTHYNGVAPIEDVWTKEGRAIVGEPVTLLSDGTKVRIQSIEVQPVESGGGDIVWKATFERGTMFVRTSVRPCKRHVDILSDASSTDGLPSQSIR